ncbi:hypothetical protein CYFUS_008376 [Cystobacter fuscus]|uniref:EamA domain-containing protein n=1 Tax=Cystobacter fuscus TaxID=43 RepID=A0A250JHD2_9BACT|nr:hypothetical protein [Cystobacter fuscus]ATB42897.1 hypothetical protein CYFUS_008376 [Cystobacter fuscus]
MSRLSGPFLIMLFALVSALRDVYLGEVFQNNADVFFVAMTAFSTCSAFFLVWSALADRGQLRMLLAHPGSLLWMNVTTALAWIFYLLALRTLEPLFVNMLWAVTGPLTVVALDILGIRIEGSGRIGRVERWFQAGNLLSLVFLVSILLGGRTGVPYQGQKTAWVGVSLTIASGASSAIGILFSKRLHDQGIGARPVMATRFVGTSVLAAFVLLAGGSAEPTVSLEPARWASVVAASGVLVALPIYVFQAGMRRTTPMTAEVILASSPILVFVLQSFDKQVAFAPYSLVAVLLYVVFSAAGLVARAMSEAFETPPSGGGERGA